MMKMWHLSRRHGEITRPTAWPGYREDRRGAEVLYFTQGKTSNQPQRSQCYATTKAAVIIPAVLNRGVCGILLVPINIFFFNLHFMQLWPPWHSRLDMCCSMNTTLSYPNRHLRHMHRRLHWLSLQSQSGEGSEVEARAASILQAIHSQQYESLQPWPAVIINSIVYKHSIRCKQLS